MSVEFVGIELDLRGEEEVYNDLKKIDNLINSLGGKKKLDMGLSTLKRDLAAARGELEKFKRLREQYLKSGGKGNAFVGEIDEAKHRVNDLNQALREVRASASSIGPTFKQSFNRANSVITHIGSKMQSLGNAMTRLSTPFTRLTTGFVMGAGYKALNTVTEGLSRGFTRYDTMKKYPKIMAAFGYSAKEAKDSIDALDMSVRGLPTGLDEMVDLAQRFTATTGDIQKGTKLAIATNNAFLASMSTDTQKYQGMMQLQDVLGGKDMNSREWNSLVSSMTPAITKMGEFLKKSGEWNGSIGEFIQHVRDGKMANEDFIDTLIKIGNKGGVLEAMAQESKDTWAAFFANVGNASARMAEGIIKSFDEISRQAFGKDLNMLFIDNIIPAIDNMAKSVQGWIKAHPQEILNFFNDLKSIDWTGLIKGFAQGTLELARMLTSLAKTLGGGDLSKFGRNLIRMSWLGRGITVLGGVLKGTSGLFATVYATTKTLKRARGAGSLLDAIGVLLGDKGGDIGKAAERATKAGGSMGKFSLGLSNFFKGWAQIATAVGGTAFVGWASFKAFKSMAKDLAEIVDIVKGIDWKVGAASLTAMGGAIAAFIGLGSKIGGKMGLAGLKGEAILGAMTTFASGVFALDMNLIKRGFKSIADATQYINDAIDNLGKIKQIDGSVIQSVKNAVDVFNQITDVLAPERNNPVTGESEDGMKGLGRSQTKKIENISKAISALQKASGNLLKLGGVNIQEGIVSNVKNAVKSISEVARIMSQNIPAYGANGIAQGTKNIADGLYQMRRIIYSINNIGNMKVSGKGVSNIRTALNEINGAFDGEVIGDIKSKITAFTNSMREALDRFKDFDKTIVLKTKVKLGGGFSSSVSTAVRKIRQAGRDIQSAVDSIPTELSKTVTVRIVVNTIVSGMDRVRSVAQEALAASGYANGGMIYRANGGSIYRANGGGIGFPGKPKGVDKIPVWAQAGEFMQSKRAVNFFGIDFMRKVNSLDMKGAMDELMIRAGNMVGAGQSTTINNYYNNNQKVVQNINTNSPDFAFRTASRFVGAF